MALLTDVSYVIQQIRLAALHNDGGLAERVIMITTGGLDGSSYNDSMYEYVPNNAEKDDPSAPPKRRNSKTKRQSRNILTKSTVISPESPSVKTPVAQIPGPLFVKIPPAKVPATVSALSKLIQEKSGIHNAYSMYSNFCGKGEPKPIKLKIWLPFSNDRKKPMEVVVKADATVEDVIGYTLYEYTDSGRKPPVLDIINAYSLRIVEDDGVIDDDFPALERMRHIEKFSFDQFALVEAPRQQVVMAAEEAKRKSQQKSSGQVYLKIHLYSTLEIKQTSTISVPSDQILSDLLKHLCDKHKLNIEEYTLRMADTKTEIALSKTVGEINVSTLCLLKKYSHSAGDLFVRPAGERQVDEAKERRFSSIIVNEFIAYKKYNVIRRMPMFGGKQERILAIDGDFIHNMPSENRSFFDSLKTTSIHVSSVVSCELKSPSLLRLDFKKDREHKIYDLETQTPEEAEEIVTRINRLVEKSKI